MKLVDRSLFQNRGQEPLIFQKIGASPHFSLSLFLVGSSIAAEIEGL
jgi:hypothetical protein